MSKIHLIGGEKGGVGKSVVARLVAQYCIDNSLPFVGLDADESNGTFQRYYRDYTRAIDLTCLEGADEILLLATEGPDRRVLVDLPAQAERPLGAWMSESGVLEMVNEANVDMVFWHVMGDGKESVLALDRLLQTRGDSVRYVVVKNHGRGKDFSIFDKSSTRTLAESLGAHVIELPELHGPAMQKVELFDASFWAAANNPMLGAESFTRMERQRIAVWMRGAYAQFASLGETL